MPKAPKKPIPKEFKDLCERLRDYFDLLTPWLEARQAEINEHIPHLAGQHFDPDPPPRPPDLGV